MIKSPAMEKRRQQPPEVTMTTAERPARQLRLAIIEADTKRLRATVRLAAIAVVDRCRVRALLAAVSVRRVCEGLPPAASGKRLFRMNAINDRGRMADAFMASSRRDYPPSRWRGDPADELHSFERDRLWSACWLVCGSLASEVRAGTRGLSVCPRCAARRPRSVAKPALLRAAARRPAGGLGHLQGRAR